MKKIAFCLAAFIFFISCKESKSQEDTLITNKVIQIKEIERQVEIDSVEYELTYVTSKDGVWIKDKINRGKNIFFVEFNTELKLIKEDFVPVENTSLSTRWWLIRLNNKEGWVSTRDIGRKWYPDDEKLIKVTTALIDKLKKEESISPLMKDKWDLVYHEDNRCDGSTDGQLNNLKRNEIDKILIIKVINDGKGWVCDEKEETVFNLNFSLIKKINDWERLEDDSYDIGKKTSYLRGNGDSDYLVVHFEEYNGEYLIKELEYRSEDPG